MYIAAGPDPTTAIFRISLGLPSGCSKRIRRDRGRDLAGACSKNSALRAA